MKKLLKILFISLFIAGCSIISRVSPREFVLFNETYSLKDSAVLDIYSSIKLLDFDSVPLNDWMTYQGYENNGYYLERFTTFLTKDQKTQYYMIFTSYYLSDTTYFKYEIKCNTKDENIWPEKK